MNKIEEKARLALNCNSIYNKDRLLRKIIDLCNEGSLASDYENVQKNVHQKKEGFK